MPLAPIVIFCYNRPWHLSQTLNALQENMLSKESDLYFFCDGAKVAASESELEKIKEVRSICFNAHGFKSVHVIASEINMGLQQSVINGLEKVLSEFEQVIVVEDDVITSPFFLRFMNDALTSYKEEKKVLSIGSWNYFYKTNSNFFNHMPDTIAWATWRDRWALFEKDGKVAYEKLKEKKLVDVFNLGNQFNFEKMLQQQVEGKVSSWAIRWTATAVIHNTLSLYPKRSLSKHIGFGSDSTNCEGDDYNKNLVLAKEPISDFDIALKEDPTSVKEWLFIEREIKHSGLLMGAVTPAHKESLTFRIKRKLKSILNVESQYREKYGWMGDYANWAEVQKQSGGYDEVQILEKVKQSLLKVKNGEAAYERDSVAFEKLEYSIELLTSLKTCAEENGNTLSLLDFGGSLGSTYYQYRSMLPGINIHWNVVEQAHFVDCGNENFANEQLKFFKGIEESQHTAPSAVLLLSSVLAYLPDPHGFLNSILKYNFKTIIFYRTAFIEGKRDRLTLQVVPPQIYTASYPSWFFNEKNLIAQLSDKYVMERAFAGDIETEIMLDKQHAYWKGMVFKLR